MTFERGTEESHVIRVSTSKAKVLDGWKVFGAEDHGNVIPKSQLYT